MIVFQLCFAAFVAIFVLVTMHIMINFSKPEGVRNTAGEIANTFFVLLASFLFWAIVALVYIGLQPGDAVIITIIKQY